MFIYICIIWVLIRSFNVSVIDVSSGKFVQHYFIVFIIL